MNRKTFLKTIGAGLAAIGIPTGLLDAKPETVPDAPTNLYVSEADELTGIRNNYVMVKFNDGDERMYAIPKGYSGGATINENRELILE